MKISLQRLNSRSELAEERISQLEDRSIESMQFKEQRGNDEEKGTEPLRNVDTMKSTNIYAVGVPEKDRRKRKEKKECLEK